MFNSVRFATHFSTATVLHISPQRLHIPATKIIFFVITNFHLRILRRTSDYHPVPYPSPFLVLAFTPILVK